MKIIIVGIGKLGEYLAKELASDLNEVTIIDKDFGSREDIINNTDVNYLLGNGLDSSILLEAGIDKCDLLISVMDKDEQNVMCCLLGKKLGAKQTIARIRNPEYSSSISIISDELGLSMTINPEALTANQIARSLSLSSALSATSFFKGKLDIICLKIKEENKVLDGVYIHELSKKFPDFLVCGVERAGEVIIPSGKFKLYLNDKIYITGSRSTVHSFLRHASFITGKTKKVIIGGGSSIAVYLAKNLNQLGMNTKIIEIDEERCKLLSEALPDNLIINGDLSNQNVLYEEELDKCDAFVALTSIDEENIVFSMFASNLKVPKVITKINHIDLDGIVESANIDTVVTPHKIAANNVVNYVRAMKNSGDSSCNALYKISEDFELFEYHVSNDFKGLDIKIKDLDFIDDILVVAILRGKNIIFPTGKDVIKYRDTIVIASGNGKVDTLNDILR